MHYAANRECPIFEELSSILRKTTGLVDVLVNALQPLLERIYLAFAFGPIASNKAHATSDVDLVVVGSASFSEVISCLYPAQITLQREINAKVYTYAEWRALVISQGGFIKDILAKPKLNVIGMAENLALIGTDESLDGRDSKHES